MSQTLVIGATGFIGLNVTRALLDAGRAVRATRRTSSITLHLRKLPVALCHAGLDDAEALSRAMQGCGTVHFCAAHYPRYSTEPAAAYARAASEADHVVRACLAAGVRRLVYTGSSALLAPAPPGRAADERDLPDAAPDDSVYRRVKWIVQERLHEASAGGLQVLTLLPSGCIGPWDVRLGSGALLVGCVRGALPWYVDGHVQVVDVRDVARAHVLAEAEAVPAGVYCVAGHGLSLSALMRRIVRRYGGRIPADCLDAAAARQRADAEERKAQPRRARVPFPRELVDIVTAGQPICSDLARRTLNLQFTDLDASLEAAHRWFTDYGYLPSRVAGLGRTHAG